jgi:hypothetical protein
VTGSSAAAVAAHSSTAREGSSPPSPARSRRMAASNGSATGGPDGAWPGSHGTSRFFITSSSIGQRRNVTHAPGKESRPTSFETQLDTCTLVIRRGSSSHRGADHQHRRRPHMGAPEASRSKETNRNAITDCISYGRSLSRYFLRRRAIERPGRCASPPVIKIETTGTAARIRGLLGQRRASAGRTRDGRASISKGGNAMDRIRFKHGMVKLLAMGCLTLSLSTQRAWSRSGWTMP